VKARRPAGRAARPRPRSAAPRHQQRKRFGQHFLSPSWAAKVVAAIAPEPGDVFLEIGPGTGAITIPLAATGAPILAVEIDRDLARDLAGRSPSNVTILTGDVLKTDVIPLLSGLTPSLPPGTERGLPVARRLRVVGNLPYNMTSPILFRLVELYRRHGVPADATVMVQREVADRIAARPGTRDYGVLTVTLAVRARVTRLLELPPGAFTPPPQVKSTLIRLAFDQQTIRLPDEQLFEDVVKALFGQRRKTAANALKAFDRTAPAVLAIAGIDGRRRPETLTLEEIARIALLIARARQPDVV
jgi:16S rRNA (adenine1518-N6/adenine1519-N6)-dimethyltransferase